MIGTAKGTVDKVINGPFGLGLVIAESFVNRDGETKTIKYTAWFENDPGVAVGEAVEVSGLATPKIDSWTTDQGEQRQTAKITLHKSRIVRGVETPEVEEPAEAPAREIDPDDARKYGTGWGTPF